MKCPDEGTLLSYLDKELPTDQQRAVRQHLDYCSTCSCSLRELEDTLDFTGARLSNLLESSHSCEVSGQERIWSRLQPVIRSGKRGSAYMNLKKWSVAAVIVLVLGVTAFVPSFRTTVADLLQVFRVEKVETLTLSAQDMMEIQQALEAGSENVDMESFGRIETSGEPRERKLTRDELSSLPFRPMLPAGREGDYSLVTVPSMEVTPRVDKVNQLLESLGSQELLPQALDGKTFKVTMADTFVADYSDFRLTVGTSPELQVPPGVDFKEVLRPMINLPIWPEGVREQLATIDDLEHTLVIPGEKLEKVTVNGSPGVLSRDGQPTLIWQHNGLFYILTDRSGGKADLTAIAQTLE
ncbi:MAG: anti-sigma factor family protein [Deltaproteobacteria bacterium]